MDGLNLSLLAISLLQSLNSRSMLTGLGITTSSILSICLGYRQTHSLTAGRLSPRAGPGGCCLPLLQAPTSVENMGALVFNKPQTVICGIAFGVYANIQHHRCPGHREALWLSTVPGFEKNTYSCTPRNCWRLPPSLVKGESL